MSLRVQRVNSRSWLSHHNRPLVRYCKPRMRQTARGAMICCPMNMRRSTPPRTLQRGGLLTSRDLLFRLYVARRSLETAFDARTRVWPVKTMADSSHSGEADGGQKCVRIASHCQTVDRLQNHRHPQRRRRQTTTTLTRSFTGPVRRLLQTSRWKTLYRTLVHHCKVHRLWIRLACATSSAGAPCVLRPIAKVEDLIVRLRKLLNMNLIRIIVRVMNLKAWTRRSMSLT